MSEFVSFEGFTNIMQRFSSLTQNSQGICMRCGRRIRNSNLICISISALNTTTPPRTQLTPEGHKEHLGEKRAIWKQFITCIITYILTQMKTRVILLC